MRGVDCPYTKAPRMDRQGGGCKVALSCGATAHLPGEDSGSVWPVQCELGGPLYSDDTRPPTSSAEDGIFFVVPTIAYCSLALILIAMRGP